MTDFETFVDALGRAGDLDGVFGEEYLVYPPTEDDGYSTTPRNAVVFGAMGCDGVHYAVLRIDGEIGDDSPVIQIAPMDLDEPYSLLAPTFADYLATGCGTDTESIRSLLAEERSKRYVLVDYLRRNFDHSRFWTDEEEDGRDIGPYLALLELGDTDEP